MTRTLIVTGSSGLVGSAIVAHFDALGWTVHGFDNNMRADFFGAAGDTTWNRERLRARCRRFHHHDLDVRDRGAVFARVREIRPHLMVHTAAQPSHDLAARRPLDDFDVNAGGTLNLLEAVRGHAGDCTFVYFSTNKVYGTAPNELPLTETTTRWDYANEGDRHGVSESMRIDQSMHSLFGASKLGADILVQEYGRYFGMPSCCLRAGCLTGPNHSGVELHGFLSYMVKVAVMGGTYRILGYKGKQVRDNLHASDVARLIALVADDPPVGEVYNLGGGRDNACSVLEALVMVESALGRHTTSAYVDRARQGDHICYISDLRKIAGRYPAWRVEVTLEAMLDEMVGGWRDRMSV